MDTNTHELLSLLINVHSRSFAVQEKDFRVSHKQKQLFKTRIVPAKGEIAALHEGNYARYLLRPGEFKDWQKRKT